MLSDKSLSRLDRLATAGEEESPSAFSTDTEWLRELASDLGIDGRSVDNLLEEGQVRQVVAVLRKRVGEMAKRATQVIARAHQLVEEGERLQANAAIDEYLATPDAQYFSDQVCRAKAHLGL